MITPTVFTDAWSNCSTVTATKIQIVPVTSHSHQKPVMSRTSVFACLGDVVRRARSPSNAPVRSGTPIVARPRG